MDLIQLVRFVPGLLFCITIFFIARSFYKYWRLCKFCSKLPTYKETSFSSWPKLVRYANKCDNIPTSVYIIEIAQALDKMVQTGFFVAWILFPWVFIHRTKIVQEIISHPGALDKAFFYSIIKPFFGTGLITSGGNVWRSHRKLLTPAFHLSILKGYISIYNEQSIIFIKRLQGLTKEPWIDIEPFVKSCSFDVLIETAMGYKVRCQEGNEEGERYIKSVDEISEIMAYRLFRIWTHIDTLFFCTEKGRRLLKHLKVTKDISRKIIREKKEEFLAKRNLFKEDGTDDLEKSKKKSFIEILFEVHFSNETFSMKHIESEVNTFIFAGYDTTSTALKYIIYLVGQDQKVQKNITDELDSIFHEDQQRPATYDDLNSMQYLECVIKEALRLYPPVPLIGRAVCEDVKVGDYTIPKGCVLGFNLLSLHRDPDAFPNPEKFDPERFFPENVEDRHPFASIPFSAGPRNCIGQKFAMLELKVVLSHVFRNFTVVSLDPRDKIILSWDLVLKNINPIRLRLIPRQK